MAELKLSTDQMERERVARFADMKPNPMMFVDTRLPEHARDLFSVIGPGVSEDPSTRPSITDGHGFNIAYAGADWAHANSAARSASDTGWSVNRR